MGGWNSKEGTEKKLDKLREAEGFLLDSGISFWSQVRKEQSGEQDNPDLDVVYNRFDVDLAPTEQDNPVLYAEQQKYGKPLHVHTVQFGSSNKQIDEKPAADEVPIVLLHGFGSGIGIYSACLAPLTATLGRRVYAIDGLGCGLSARPKWTLGLGLESDLDKVEEYSADAIELWRQKIGAEKIILCGHSVGGYLSVAYAERYPEHLDRLVLISPAGVPTQPAGEPKKPRSMLFRFARHLWVQGYSPISLSKYFFGRVLVDQYVNRRFPEYPWLPKKHFADYLSGIWLAGEPSAGAHHHTTLLLPGVYGRNPLEHRIGKLKVPYVAAMYGTNDWMNPTRFVPVMERFAKLQEENAKEGGSGSNTGGGILRDLQFMQVDRAGHNLQLDNPLAFVAAMQAYLGRREQCTGKTFVADEFVPVQVR